MQADTVNKSSSFASFYKLSTDDRLKQVKEFAELSEDEVKTIRSGTLPFGSAERMIENVVGTFPLPLGIAVNFLVNDRDYLVPMAIEEPSVVAAASNAAKMARATGGFKASSTSRPGEPARPYNRFHGWWGEGSSREDSSQPNGDNGDC